MSSVTPPSQLQGIDRRDIVALCVLVMAGIGIPLWMAALAGAVGLPSNDDWVYMRAAASLFATDNADMPGHSAAIIGQLALVQPFLWLSAGDPWAFTAFGLVTASIGIAATYLLPGASWGRVRRSWSCCWSSRSQGSFGNRRAS